MRFVTRALTACATVGGSAGYAQAGIGDGDLGNSFLLVMLASVFLFPLFGFLILAFAFVHRKRGQRQQENRP